MDILLALSFMLIIIIVLIYLIYVHFVAILTIAALLTFIGLLFLGVYKIRHTKRFKATQAKSEKYMENHPILYLALTIGSIILFIVFRFVLK